MDKREVAGVTLTATFQAEGDSVRATFVVKFPPASRIETRKVTQLHPDLAAAHDWVKLQAKRRGLLWEPHAPAT